jgi:rhodanese-related sulfurtransferase
VEAFAETIASYRLVPEGLLVPVAIGLPVLEVAAGAGLIWDVKGSLGVITALLAIFILVLWFGILKDLDIDCGCFSPSELKEHDGLRQAMYRDFWMVGAAAYLFWWRKTSPEWFPRRLHLKEIIWKGELGIMRGKSLWVILICLTFSLGVASNGFCWGKQELETETVAVNLVREVERGGYKIVTTEELKKWMDDGKKMVIVDTMPYEASYKKNHVPGAVQMLFPIPDMNTWDTAETDGKTEADYEKLLGPDKDIAIVVYCGFVKCTRSHNGAAWAVKMGYKNVYRYTGGIKGWQEADYPVDKVN